MPSMRARGGSCIAPRSAATGPIERDAAMSTAPRTEARATAAIAEIVVRTVKIPLVTPYKVSSQVFDYFDPLVVEMRDADGRIGWGEALISSFYTNETPEGGWAFCNEMAE